MGVGGTDILSAVDAHIDAPRGGARSVDVYTELQACKREIEATSGQLAAAVGHPPHPRLLRLPAFHLALDVASRACGFIVSSDSQRIAEADARSVF